jgi:hypothetical protein
LDAHPEGLRIVLDGTNGFGSSFLDEAFGGLIRERRIDPTGFRNKFEFVSFSDPSYIEEIYESVDSAMVL